MAMTQLQVSGNDRRNMVTSHGHNQGHIIGGFSVSTCEHSASSNGRMAVFCGQYNKIVLSK